MDEANLQATHQVFGIDLAITILVQGRILAGQSRKVAPVNTATIAPRAGLALWPHVLAGSLLKKLQSTKYVVIKPRYGEEGIESARSEPAKEKTLH